MGYGAYSYEAHQAITSKRAELPAQKVFTQSKCHPLMNPFGVKLRESRDSADHPQSLSIAFALDVSGSMGAIPEQLAKKELPTFMKVLGDVGVKSPQVLFMAFQDTVSSPTPLQVGQFESTAELMDQWLTWCWLEGGGGSALESYELPMYFAARHTAIDCWEKRKHKGYFFMTGDEPSYDRVHKEHVKKFLGHDIPADIPLSDVYSELSQRYEPFFLIPDPQRAQNVGAYWRGIVGDRAIALSQPGDTCAVAAGLVALIEGAVANLAALGAKLEESGTDRARVKAVFESLTPWAKAHGKA